MDDVTCAESDLSLLALEQSLASAEGVNEIVSELAKAEKTRDYYRVLDIVETLRRVPARRLSPRLRAAMTLHAAASLLAMRAIGPALAASQELISELQRGLVLKANDGKRLRALIAQILPRAGRLDEALSMLRAMIMDEPKSPTLHVRLGHLLAPVAPDESITALRTAKLLTDKAGPRLWLSVAETLGEMGQLDEASTEAEAALAAFPNHAELLLCCANACLRLGDRAGWARHLRGYLMQCGGPLELRVTDDCSRHILARILHTAPKSQVLGGPEVCVVVTAFNAEATIAMSVQSVLSQSYQNLRVFVIDDASTDGTWRLLQRLAARDSRLLIRRLSQNVGTYVAKNMALQEASAEYVTFHDADDWMHPERVAQHVQAMEADAKLVCSNSKWFRMTEAGLAVMPGRDGYVMNNPASSFIRRSVLQDVGLFDSVRFGGDSELIWRLRRRFGIDAVRTIDAVLAIGLAHRASLTRSFAPLDKHGKSDERSTYNEAWIGWHRSVPAGGRLYMPFPLLERPYPAPSAFRAPLPTQVELTDHEARSRIPGRSALVLTIAYGTYANTWAFCLAAQAHYAKRWRLRHLVLDQLAPGLNAKWSKLHFACQLVEEGQDVLLIDADAEPSVFAPSFTEILDLHPDRSIFYARGNSGRPNSGVLMFRGGSEIAFGFLRECLAARGTRVSRENFVTEEGENGHVIQLLKIPMFTEASHEVSRLWNCTHPDDAAEAYIRHYTNRLGRSLKIGQFVHPDDPRIAATFTAAGVDA